MTILKKDIISFKESLVDDDYYKNIYSDVEILNWSSHYHFLKFGRMMGRKRFDFDEKLTIQPEELTENIVAGVASMPSREKKLEMVIEKIIPQVNSVHVYLNNYNEIPNFLNNSKITIHKSQDHGDLRDNGKFFGLQFISNKSYYVTLDDDINYPDDYIYRLVKKLKKYNNNCVVGVHGVTYGKWAKSFFDRQTFHFEKELIYDTPVTTLGTGTTAFLKERVPIKLDDFHSTGKADLYLSAFLKKNKIPAICISRKNQWIKDFDIHLEGDKSIYQETKLDTSPYDNVIKENAPWGYESIYNCLTNKGLARESIGFKLIDVLSKFEKEKKSTLNLHDSLSLLYYEEHYKSDILIKEIYFTIIHSLLLHEVHHCCNNNVQTKFLDEIKTIVTDKNLNIFKRCEYNTTNTYKGKIVIPDVATQEFIQLLEKKGMFEAVTAIQIILFLRGQDKDPYQIITSAYNSGDYNIIKLFERSETDFPLKSLSDNQLVELAWIATNSNSKNLYKKIHTIALNKNIASLVFIKSEIFYQVKNNKDKLEENLLLFLKSEGRRKEKHAFDVTHLILGKTTHPFIKNIVEWLSILENENNHNIKAYSLLLISYFTNDNILLLHKEKIKKEIKNLNPSAIEKDILLSTMEFRITKRNDLILNCINKISGLPPIKFLKNKKGFFQSIYGDSKLLKSDITNNSLVSVIICSFNDKETLQYSYDSIVGQKFKNLEIIIVDDSSEIPVEEFLTISKNVKTKITRNEKNLGPYLSRNKGLELATGNFISFHDADDWAHPDKLTIQLEILYNNPDKIAVYDKHLRIRDNGLIVPENNLKFIGDGPITALFRNEVFKKIGIFSPVRTRGDIEFKNRIKTIIGNDAILYSSQISILALDWISNSKPYNYEHIKHIQMRDFKNKSNSLNAFLVNG